MKKFISIIIGGLIAFVLYVSLLTNTPQPTTTVFKPINVEKQEFVQVIDSFSIELPEGYQLNSHHINQYKNNGTFSYSRQNPMWYWVKPVEEPVAEEESKPVQDNGGKPQMDFTKEINSNPKFKKVNEILASESSFPIELEFYNITSHFGKRIDPFLKTEAWHTGIDLSINGIEGTPVKSIYEGKIVDITRNDKNGESEEYGNCIIIEHDGFTTLYAHLKEINENIEIDTVVKEGDIIGTVGNTGRSTGPHLHFELIIDNNIVNPYPFLETIKKGV